MSELETFLASSQTRCEAHLKLLLNHSELAAEALKEAVAYSLLTGGKRVRPALVYAAAQACGGITEVSDNFACAVEAIHCYSLIHDDLPAMDNDDLRRGKPTNHKVYGDATAILAGDVLQSLAFQWLVLGASEEKSGIHVEAVAKLAAAASAMVAGQTLDIAATEKSLSLEALQTMHRNKTGALISVSLTLGALSAGANASQREALETYGRAIGLAFQVKDDILDVEADTATLGKQQGADAHHNKPTYVSLLGLQGAKSHASQLLEEATTALDGLQGKGNILKQLASYIINRQY